MGTQRPVDVHPLPLPLLVHIVNDWGDAPRAAAGVTDPRPSVGHLRTESPAVWAHFPDLDENALTKLANLVHPVFTATTGAECVERLNELLARAKVTSALSSDVWAVHEVWRAARPDQALLASATLSLIQQLRREPDASRLGTCAGEACVDVYVDQSPGGRRQYCSLTCQNRARARAYRATKRAAR